MLPVCLEAELSEYAPAEASTRCLGFQAMESTTGCVPLTPTVHGFLPASNTTLHSCVKQEQHQIVVGLQHLLTGLEPTVLSVTHSCTLHRSTVKRCICLKVLTGV